MGVIERTHDRPIDEAQTKRRAQVEQKGWKLAPGELMTLTQIVTNVARGVVLLDRVVPDWADRIDLEALDMTSSSKCVLGQLFGLYDIGRATLNLSDSDVITHGFVPPSDENEDTLRTLWTQAIRHRQWRPVLTT